MTRRSLDFPNKNELRSANSIEFKVFIPSTRNKNVRISNSAFKKRLNQSISFFTNKFGGTTIDVETGTYQLKGKVIKEKVAVIVVSATKADYNKFDEDIEKWLQVRKKSWGQDSMGFVYQGKMIFV